jgi:iron complex outermembrane receptor protein
MLSVAQTTSLGVNLNNGIQGNGRVFKQNVDVHSVLVEHYLTYNKTFSGGSVINAVGGYSYQNFQNEYNGVIGWGLSTPVVNPNDVFVKDFNNFTNYYDDVPGFEKAQLQSFFGRVNYSLSEKYFLTATVRADGSSRFGANNRYGVFPAFAAKWRLLRENFAQGLTNTFSDLSIRANWGKLGSQEGIGAYDAYNLQQTYKGNSGPNEVQLRHLGNPDLQWEEATTTGVGLDFALRNSRLTGAIDYYNTKRDNLLFFGPTPGGFAPTANWFTNLPGHVVNTGVEVSFDFMAVKNSNFSWDIDYNMTFMHNEMKDFPLTVITGGVNGQGLSGAYAQTIVDGYPLFTWKMPVFEGYDKDGFATYANGGQDQLLGSALPTFTAGLTNNFTYKNWSASIFFNAVTGFSVYNNTANALFLKGAIKNGRNVTYDVASSPESPINPGSVSTRFLEDGDFIRLSNASISYAFNLKNTKTIKSLALSVIGQNLALFTDYSGLDPEINVDHNINGVPSRGFDYTAYPRPRTVTFGLNLGF